MKALIFGANGQTGHYLIQLCKELGYESVGVSRSGSWTKNDVSKYQDVEQVILEHRPTHIIHLAARSTTRHDALFENHATIATGTLNILEAARLHTPGAKIFITGSGVQFMNTGQPISEDDPFDASSPYAVERIHSVYAARYYRKLGLNVYVGYLFHHESPYRKPNHVSKLISLAANRIASGSREIIELGDISVRKEWTFAGDVAKGIFSLMEQNNVFEAVIGSGIPYSIENWLDQCFCLIGKNWRDHVRIREGFKAEYSCLVSNPKTINSLGWFPTVKFSELAAMMVASSEEISKSG